MIQLHPEIVELIKSDEEVLEPETLRQVHPELTEQEFNQVMAFKTLKRTRGFWENCYIFEDIVQALSGRIPDPHCIEGALPEEIWYAMDIANRIFPGREFSDEVIAYIKYFSHEAGVYVYPPYLPIPNPFYSIAAYKSENGPFPLGESEAEIQAAKYLAIQEYIKNQRGII